jgi:hypothetical protein
MKSDSRGDIQGSLLTATLAILVAVLFVLSLMTGPASFSPRTVIAALFSDQGVASIIVRDIRLPRTLLALMIGATFGLAGASLQGLLRNPLAEPSLFGAPQAQQRLHLPSWPSVLPTPCRWPFRWAGSQAHCFRWAHWLPSPGAAHR